MTRWRLSVAALALTMAIAALAGAARSRVSADVPDRLADAEFWQLVQQFSEPDGYFDSDNLVSNEDTFQTVIPELQRVVPAGRVYLGVGPDQNFTYIAALAPRLAFIVDVRRGNMQVHLMYKALFELSETRADFLARLFSRPKPDGLGPGSTAGQMFAAFARVPPSAALRSATLEAIGDLLVRRHGFVLAAGDLPAIARVLGEFHAAGPNLRFVSSRPNSWYPSFEAIQTSTDASGVERSYLSSEERYRRVRALQQANAIVPVVGNFAGHTALKAIGQYMRAHGAAVGAFYTSNVERYLFQDGVWPAFVDNVAALPSTETSTFIRSCFDSCSSGGSRAVSLLDSMPALLDDVRGGRVRTYADVLGHGRRR